MLSGLGGRNGTVRLVALYGVLALFLCAVGLFACLIIIIIKCKRVLTVLYIDVKIYLRAQKRD